MRTFILSVSLMCLGFSVSAQAQSDEGMSVIRQIKVHGLGLSSTPTEINAYFDKFGESMGCQKFQSEQQERGGKIYPRSYSWTCRYPADPMQIPTMSWYISYAHDRVSSIDYRGPNVPDFGGDVLSDYLSGLHDRLKNNPSVRYDYKYGEYGETVEATDHVATYSINANVDGKCALEGGREVDYTVGADIVYSKQPSSGQETGTVKLSDNYIDRCKKTLN